MTCADVTELLDSFVDTELAPSTLVAVARHAAGCAGCDAAVRELTAVHEAVERTMSAEADTLDLSRVWPSVAAAAARVDARRAWAARLRQAPVWGAMIAMAATAVFWLRPAATLPVPGPIARARPNQAVIDRLDTSAHVELRRDRKYGTTLIMVSAPATETP